MSKRKKPQGDNAFTALMQRKKPGPSPSSSSASASRVTCPICGTSVSSCLINAHIDQCSASGRRSSAAAAAADRDPTCKACTFENAKGSEACAVCGSELALAAVKKGGSGLKAPAQTAAAVTPASSSSSPAAPPAKKAQSSPSAPSAFATLMATRQSPHARTFTLVKEALGDFRVRWSRGKAPSPLAVSTVKPSQASGCECEVSLCFEGEKQPPHTTNPYKARGMSSFSPGVLKSLLQKSVRRRSPRKAAAAANELIYKDLTQLLRRLPIIMVEDVGLVGERFGVLVWLMMADSRDVDVLSLVGEETVLKIVWEMAGAVFKRGDEGLEVPGEARRLEETDCALRAACMIRERFGGMRGDQDMLKRAVTEIGAEADEALVKQVEERFGLSQLGRTWTDVANAVYFQASKAGGAWSKPPPLTVENVCSAGVDFHCSDIVDDVLENNAENAIMKGVEVSLGVHGFEEINNEIKSAMWENEAGVNLKVKLESEGGAGSGEGQLEGQDDKLKRKLAFDLLTPYFKTWRLKYIEKRAAR